MINAYLLVRDAPMEVIKELRKLRNSETDYYAVRASAPRSDARRAARLIYLTTLAFNGIYRVNLKGQFNVPYGHRVQFDHCDEARILESSVTLKKARLAHADFEEAVRGARAGDFVYLDPPYTVAHGDNGFVKYNSKIFCWEDQVRLASVARALSERGCTVVVSNADHDSLIRLYTGFAMKKVRRNSVIAASSGSRSTVTECLFLADGRSRLGPSPSGGAPAVRRPDRSASASASKTR